ncbi:MAG: magnesium chelatase subunit D family protein [Chloroflexi bacterium]|nr:magnesium chelatase subunit D family protein [Chloroflexota bacterium]
MSTETAADTIGVTYPFAAIVGQDRMKLALLANAVNPAIGGVLIRGERGTAKSTAVRGLAVILPAITVATCRYRCDPDSGNLCHECRQKLDASVSIETESQRVRVVDLPVSATEDRVVGTIDLETVLRDGRRSFEPGLLADAHRGILYVDEVNLLDDHLVDTLLDSAASGVNRVEREGVAFHHPAEFILVGTMNPEEGDLRPQLLDRFGLAAEIKGDRDPKARAEIVRRRLAFESDTAAFLEQWRSPTNDLMALIERARGLLPTVGISDHLLGLITHIANAMGVDGHRADIVMYKTAQTIAALDGRSEVTLEDVRRAAELALPHRRRRDPFTPPGLDPDELDRAIQAFEARPAPAQATDSAADATDGAAGASDSTMSSGPAENGPPGDATEADQRLASDEATTAPPVNAPERIPFQKPRTGRRTSAEVKGRRGHSVRSRPMDADDPPDIAVIDTVRAAAARRTQPGTPQIDAQDLRVHRRMRKVGNLMLFVVDGSGSMAAQRRMQLTKSAVLSLLADAYKRRDRVGVITFRKTEAYETVPPTSSLDVAHARMHELPTGGRTPLAHGLELARLVVERERARDAQLRPILILLTDGVANVGLAAGSDPITDALQSAGAIARDRVPALVVDADRRHNRSGSLVELAKQMAAAHVRLDALAAGQLTSLIRLAAA